MAVPIPDALTRLPFSVAEANALGVSRKVLRGSRFRSVFPNVFTCVELELTDTMRVLAAQKSVGDHAPASHESGLAAWGVEIGTRGSVHLTTRRASPTRIPGLTMHRSRWLGDVAEVGGIRVLAPQRCLVDSCTRRRLVDLVIAGDWLIRNGHMTADSFTDFAQAFHFDGIVKARRVAQLIEPAVESPRESSLRMLIVLAELPRPEINRTFRTEQGLTVRLDLAYLKFKVAIEYDGRQHFTDISQWERDVRRRESMERDGWLFIVVTNSQMTDPRSVVRRVFQALQSRGHSGRAPEFTREWCTSFEN